MSNPVSSSNHINSSQLTHRITIAWSISECALGGVMHAVQSPFTGLFVGGLSILFISLIAFHSDKPSKAILQAVLFVLAVKFTISPHSPLGAFLAVSIQACIGAFFFQVVPKFSFAAMLTAVLSLALSAIQKVIILTIIFGQGLWVAIDALLEKILKQLPFLEVGISLANGIIGVYIAIYVLGGILIGFLAGKLPTLFESKSDSLNKQIERFSQPLNQHAPIRKKRKWVNLSLVIITVLLLQFFIFNKETALSQLIRTVAVIILWLGVIRPILNWVIKREIRKKKESLLSEINTIQNHIPSLINFGKYAWKIRREGNGFPAMNFLTLYLYYAIYRL